MGDGPNHPAEDGRPASGLPASLHQTLPQTQRRPDWSAARRDIGEVVVRAVMSAAWYSRNPRTKFAASPRPAPDRFFYQADDGWESPIWRYPPKLGASGEPAAALRLAPRRQDRQARRLVEQVEEAEGAGPIGSRQRGAPGSSNRRSRSR